MLLSHDISRRAFLKLLGLASSATALGACARTVPTLAPTSTVVIPNTPTSSIVPTSTKRPLPEAIFPEMVLVEPGTFLMGMDDGYNNEGPEHEVTITRAYTIGIYAVTFKEYARYCDEILKCPKEHDEQGREDHPITYVDWYDAVAYCNWLSVKAGLTPCYVERGKHTKCDFNADGYRLPTEAEWEYAAKGGTKSEGYLYAGSDDPDEVGWHAGNSGGSAHPVGQLKPNELGIFDMSGNRWEWCWDWYGEGYYAVSPAIDPTGPTEIPTGTFIERSRRSSSARENSETLRTTFRSRDGVSYPGDNGLRLVRTV